MKKTTCSRTPSFIHKSIQYGYFLFFIYIGYLFYNYFLWATAQTEIYTQRPPSVEAFLPIGAFASAKLFLLRGEFDPVHPAALVLLLMAICVSFFFRKAVCGYLCPIGCVSGILERFGKKIGISYNLGEKTSFVLSIVKYLFFLSFVWLIWWGMDLDSIRAFVRTPYYQVADSKMLLFFLQPSAFFLSFLFILLIGSIIIPSFWCRYLCPYGALMGVISLFSPVAVRRDKETCINCLACSKACPTGIAVHKKIRINTPECMGCLECVSSCPKDKCLTVGFGYHKEVKTLPVWAIAVGTLFLLAIFYLWAVNTNHWQTNVDLETVKYFHKMILTLDHP